MFKNKSKPNTRRLRSRKIDGNVRKQPATFSYHANRKAQDIATSRGSVTGDTENSPLKLKSLGANFTTIILCLAVLSLVVMNSFVSFDTPRVVIHGDDEQASLLKQNSLYQDQASKILEKSLLNKFKLTTDTSGFAETFAKENPEVASASLQLSLIGSRPTVHITPSVPVLEVVSLNGGASKVDISGRVISINSDAVDDGSIRVNDSSGFTAKVGSQVLSSKDVRFIIGLSKQMTENDIDVASYELLGASRQLNMKLSGKQYYIKFSFENDLRQQAGAYIGVQKRLDDIGETPTEYIDVRVGDRAYYK